MNVLGVFGWVAIIGLLIYLGTKCDNRECAEGMLVGITIGAVSR